MPGQKAHPEQALLTQNPAPLGTKFPKEKILKFSFVKVNSSNGLSEVCLTELGSSQN